MKIGTLPFVALLSIGCAGKTPTMERYIPKAESARAAVAAALGDWREGHAPGVVAGTHPQVCVVDNYRKPGQRLRQFEIMGEVASDGGRGFAVRLDLENPDEAQQARFLAIGIDPIWVYRQEDFENMSHWMHKMEEPEAP